MMQKIKDGKGGGACWSLWLWPCITGRAIFKRQSIVSWQTYRDLELIIVDDASTDATGAILQSIDDRRVKVVRLLYNAGAAAALNLAIERARGNWIAVHDADDLSHPHRIAEQVRYLAENPGLAAVGSFIECFTGNGMRDRVSEGELRWYERTRNSVRTASDIRLGLYSGCPITHGTLLIAKKLSTPPAVTIPGCVLLTTTISAPASSP